MFIQNNARGSAYEVQNALDTAGYAIDSAKSTASGAAGPGAVAEIRRQIAAARRALGEAEAILSRFDVREG